MSQVLFMLSTIIFMSMIWHVNCIIECEEPPASTDIFLDLPKLQLLFVQHRDVFQTPLRCTHDNGTSTCTSQVCCEDEVGCCFRDPDSGRQACGCKLPTDSDCSFPAPLAFLRTSVCEPSQYAQISVCIRKVREDDSDVPSITIFSEETPYRLLGGNTGLVDNNPLADSAGNIFATSIGSAKGLIPKSFLPPKSLEEFTVSELENGLAMEILDELVDRVVAKRAKGTGYGRENTRQI